MGKHMVLRAVPASQSLGTLADDGVVNLFNSWGSALAQDGFLFEVEADGDYIGGDASDTHGGQGVSVLLIRNDATTAEIDAALNGDLIAEQDVREQYPVTQKVFAIATQELVEREAVAGKASFKWSIHFAPGSKGGIPMLTGTGWSITVMNRSGGALTTGGIVRTSRLKWRFAYAE